MSSGEPRDELSQRQWFIVRRWQEYDGEWRANALRVLCVGAFYLTQLVQYHGLAVNREAERPFHRAVTALVVVWIAVALAVHLALRSGILPWGLRYATTAADLILLTSAGMLGSGADSPVAIGYFLLIAISALRFDLVLVRCATFGALAGYLAMMLAKEAGWGGPETGPIVRRLVMLISLGACGIVLGQIMRRAEQLAKEFERRCRAARGGQS